MEYLILQNTRLNLVMRMADIISSGIHFNIWKYVKDNNVEDQLDQKHGEQSNSSKCVELGNQ